VLGLAYLQHGLRRIAGGLIVIAYGGFVVSVLASTR
jgi:hypothetical protein